MKIIEGPRDELDAELTKQAMTVRITDLNKFCEIKDEVSYFSTMPPIDADLMARVEQRHSERMAAMTREQLEKYIMGDWRSNNRSSTVGKLQVEDFAQVIRSRSKSRIPDVQRWLMDVGAAANHKQAQYAEMVANYYKARSYRTPTALRRSHLYTAIQQVNRSNV